MSIKTKLHILLAERRMSQKDLIELTGIRSSTMSMYYNDTYKEISKKNLDKICKALDCKVEDIIEYVKDEED